jgi:hypothetical protein
MTRSIAALVAASLLAPLVLVGCGEESRLEDAERDRRIRAEQGVKRQTTLTHYVEDGVPSEAGVTTNVVEYNKRGDLVKWELYKFKGKPYRTGEMIYDDTLRVESIVYDENGNVEKAERHEYADGVETRTVTVDSTGATIVRAEREYDADGDLESVAYYAGESDRGVGYEEFRFEGGVLVHKTSYNETGAVRMKEAREYENGLLVEVTRRDGRKKVVERRKYERDENGDPIELRAFGAGDELLWRYEATFENGLEVERKLYDAEDSLTQVIRHKYECFD